MLINLSNHPSNKWGKKQQDIATESYGIISDLPFPAIDPNWEEEKIQQLCDEYFNKIAKILDQCANESKQNSVHIHGEFTFVFKLVTLLKSSDIVCIASTSERKVQEIKEKKIVEFKFVQFRKY